MDFVVARVSIEKPGKMLPEFRQEIAEWLRRVADGLVEDGERYTDSGPYRARYYAHSGDRETN